MLAFPMNFIPTLGATIASVPPMLMAIAEPSLSSLEAGLVCAALVVINVVIGTFVEPRYLGRALSLSPLVVFVSMLLWYLIWGPIGAVLAVPITVATKVICSHVRGLERIAIVLKA
jgi:predicted PurR-regulated permease PerM